MEHRMIILSNNKETKCYEIKIKIPHKSITFSTYNDVKEHLLTKGTTSKGLIDIIHKIIREEEIFRGCDKYELDDDCV